MQIGEFKFIYDPAVGETEPWCINDHCFAKGPDGLWHLFAITHIKPFDFDKDPGRNLAHATARSLTQPGWYKKPFAVTIDPARYDEHLLWAPHVVKHDKTYHMFVCTGARSGHRYAIHRLTSQDLWQWCRLDITPVVIDGFDARDAMVILDGDRWLLYYTANDNPDGGHHIVACLESSDLINWGQRRVAFTHPLRGTSAGPTESPFVVRRGRVYYLFVTDGGTVHVYRTDSPTYWAPKDEVHSFEAHACEVVRDEQGNWFVSHVGWMNGGLCLASISWDDGQDDESASIDPTMF